MNSKNFTYGFEVEGLFRKEMIRELKKKWNVNAQADGSVKTYNISYPPDVDVDVQEIAVGIFNGQKELIKALEMIKPNENHFFDRSCGLHLHIKPKKNRQEIESRIGDFTFLRKIQDYAYSNLCEHIKARKKNTYCEPYKRNDYARSDWSYHSKYRFIRRHDEYHTLEMRFFSPCEHKVENINKFLEFFFNDLRGVEAKKEFNIRLPIRRNTETISEDYFINTGADTIREDFLIDMARSREIEIGREHKNDYDYCHCCTDCIQESLDNGCECDECNGLYDEIHTDDR